MKKELVHLNETPASDQNESKSYQVICSNSVIFVVETQKERAATIRSYEREREKLRAAFEAMLSGTDMQKKPG